MPFRARLLPSSIPKRRLASIRHAPVHTRSQRAGPSSARPSLSSPFPGLAIRYASTDAPASSTASSSSSRTPSSSSSPPTPPSFSSASQAAPPPSRSRLAQLFSFRPSRPPSLHQNNARTEFLSRAERGELDRMMMAYEIALTSARSVSVSGYTAKDGGELLLSREDLWAGMRALAKARDAQAAAGILEGMVRDAKEVFGYETGQEEWTALAIGLFRAERGDEAFTKLREVLEDGGEVDLSEIMRVVATETYEATRDEHVRSLWGIIGARRRPTDEDWKTFFDHLRRESPKRPHHALEEIEGLHKTVEATSKGGLGEFFGKKGSVAASRAILKAGGLGWAEKQMRREDSMRKRTNNEEVFTFLPLNQMLESEDEWKWRIEYTLAQSSPNTVVLDLCMDMKEAGFDVPQGALKELVTWRYEQGMGLEQAVKDVEGKLDIAIDSKGWTMIMEWLFDSIDKENLSREAGLQEIEDRTTEACRVARRCGATIDWDIASVVIGVLSDTSEAHTDLAFEIYREAMRNDDGIPSPRRTRQLQNVYRMLLNCCVRGAEGEVPRSADARDLLAAAAGMNVSIPNYSDELNALIRAAPDHEIAYEIYAFYHQVNPIDDVFFQRIANNFISLTPRGSDFLLPPADLLLELVKNMHATGVEPGPFIFTSLVTRYGWLASQKKGVPNDIYSRRLVALQTAVSDIHNRIKLDPSIVVDIPLLNALMDAYNRIGQPHIAFTIWNGLVDRRSRTDPSLAKAQYPKSVAIALDLCSYNSMEARLRRIWAWARRHGFADEVRSWNGYVEALSRLSKFQEATDVVVRQMKDGVDGAPPPNIHSVIVLLKFGWKAGAGRRAIVESVKTEVPWLWDQAKYHAASREEQER